MTYVEDNLSSALDELSPGSDPAPLTGAEITVLVVDDEPSNLTSLQKIFQREGLRVFTAESAKSALEIVRKHRVQVVLTDLMMPGTNGLELLRALKEVSPDTETVMMTAYGTVETAVQAMRSPLVEARSFDATSVAHCSNSSFAGAARP